MTGPGHAHRAVALLSQADNTSLQHGAGHPLVRGLVELAQAHLAAAQLALAIDAQIATAPTDDGALVDWDDVFTTEYDA